MKRLILSLCFALLAVFANASLPVNHINWKKIQDCPAVPAENLSESKDIDDEVKVQMQLDLDDALGCKITITVTIGVVSVSGTVWGPCDEVKALAVQLIGDLIDQAKDIVKKL